MKISKLKTELKESKKLKKVDDLQIIVNDIIFRLNNAYQMRNPIEIDNVNKELELFFLNNKFNIDDKAVTSMQKELGVALDFEEVAAVFKEKLAQQFNFQYV